MLMKVVSTPRLTNAVRSLSITVPAAAAIAPTRIAALARFAEKAKVTAVARLPALRRAATLVAFVHSLEASAQDDALEVLDRLLRDIFGAAEKADRKARLRSLKRRDVTAAVDDLRRDSGTVRDRSARPRSSGIAC